MTCVKNDMSKHTVNSDEKTSGKTEPGKTEELYKSTIARGAPSEPKIKPAGHKHIIDESPAVIIIVITLYKDER